MTPTSPGQMAYDTYRAYAGETWWLPWDRGEPRAKRAWEAAAEAVRALKTQPRIQEKTHD